MERTQLKHEVRVLIAALAGFSLLAVAGFAAFLWWWIRSMGG